MPLNAAGCTVTQVARLRRPTDLECAWPAFTAAAGLTAAAGIGRPGCITVRLGCATTPTTTTKHGEALLTYIWRPQTVSSPSSFFIVGSLIQHSAFSIRSARQPEPRETHEDAVKEFRKFSKSDLEPRVNEINNNQQTRREEIEKWAQKRPPQADVYSIAAAVAAATTVTVLVTILVSSTKWTQMN